MSSVEEMFDMDLSPLVGTLTTISPSIVVVWRDYNDSLGWDLSFNEFRIFLSEPLN